MAEWRAGKWTGFLSGHEEDLGLPTSVPNNCSSWDFKKVFSGRFRTSGDEKIATFTHTGGTSKDTEFAYFLS